MVFGPYFGDHKRVVVGADVSLPISIETCMQNLGLLSAVSQIQGFHPLSNLTNYAGHSYTALCNVSDDCNY